MLASTSGARWPRIPARLCLAWRGNLVISRTDLAYRCERWWHDTAGVLLIAGYSGSGKTLLAHEIAGRCQAVHVNLELSDTEVQALAAVRQLHPDAFWPEYQRLASAHLRAALAHPGKRVVEGSLIALFDAPETLRQHAILITGTSAARSLVRAYERNRLIEGRPRLTTLREVLENLLWPQLGALVHRVRRWKRVASCSPPP